MEFWFFLALVPVLFWGIAVALAKVSTSRLGIARVTFLISVIESVMYFTGFISFRTNQTLNAESVAIGLASAFVGMVAYVCFYESMVEGQVAILGTISAAYPAISIVGALLLLSEKLTTYEALSLIAIMSGILALSYERSPDSPYKIPKRSLIFALLAFLLWGFWGLTAKIALNDIGPGNVFGCYVLSSLTIPTAYSMLRKARRELKILERPSWTLWGTGAAGVALNVTGTLIFAFALNIGQASLVVPVSSAYPLVTIVVAILLLGEKLNRIQLIALVFVLIGIVTIGMTS
ncbi:MAG TPA: EamA family transporter [Terriglobales bacterium]|nr:EamA family transporter [Terriglobales bacterium]